MKGRSESTIFLCHLNSHNNVKRLSKHDSHPHCQDFITSPFLVSTRESVSHLAWSPYVYLKLRSAFAK